MEDRPYKYLRYGKSFGSNSHLMDQVFHEVENPYKCADVGEASVGVHASSDTEESTLEKNRLSVLTVGKVSVTIPISLPTRESTQEKSLISVVNVENASVRAQAL